MREDIGPPAQLRGWILSSLVLLLESLGNGVSSYSLTSINYHKAAILSSFGFNTLSAIAFVPKDRT